MSSVSPSMPSSRKRKQPSARKQQTIPSSLPSTAEAPSPNASPACKKHQLDSTRHAYAIESSACEHDTSAYAQPQLTAHHHHYTTCTLRFAKHMVVRIKRNIYTLLRETEHQPAGTADTFLPQHGITAGEFSVGQYVTGATSCKAAEKEAEDMEHASMRYMTASGLV